MNLKNLYHFYSRIGFGISIDEAKKLEGKSPEELIDQQLNVRRSETRLKLVHLNDILDRKSRKDLSPLEKRDVQKKLREKVKELNTVWMKQLIQTPNVLLERMTLFWHGHFACRVEHPYLAQELNNIQRKYAFAPFKELLLEVSKSAAMLQFLNNRQNKKMHPNENFARELMELFTIGRGNYTENDIKESARAFTGWTFDNDSYEFVFNQRQHDTEEKTFMGKSGYFTGEDIIDILLTKKETARFLCEKMYVFFINEKVDEKRLDELTDFYYSNRYDTGKLLKKIMCSNWFYDEENKGAIIKSPVDFIVSFSRTFRIIPSDLLMLKLQKSMDQILFYPPNVAGWPGGKDWIDSTTLMFRLKIPSTLLNGGKVTFLEKDNMPEDTFNLPDTVQAAENPSISLLNHSNEEIIEALLRVTPDEKNKMLLLGNITEPRQLVLKLVSMPEYQVY
ncbi:MAG TPA: DUF1800 domain-containing protein [Cytophagaceae bacterium]|jgi:uncharacterized protein (DUF1800 family)|nr:DUF1800 domain-containing protein [Cytophagaceae bacterium]